MANLSKAKGDAAERELVAVLLMLASDLCVDNPMRMLGAGRKDDIGDLRVLHDVTIQSKAYKNLSTGLRLGAMGAVEQQARAGTTFAFGASPIPRAQVGRPDKVRWLVSAIDWPAPDVGERATTETFQAASFAKAVAWLRDPHGDIPIDQRVVELVMAGKPTLWIGPIQAWLRDYRAAVGGVDPDLRATITHHEGATEAGASNSRTSPTSTTSNRTTTVGRGRGGVGPRDPRHRPRQVDHRRRHDTRRSRLEEPGLRHLPRPASWRRLGANEPIQYGYRFIKREKPVATGAV